MDEVDEEGSVGERGSLTRHLRMKKKMYSESPSGVVFIYATSNGILPTRRAQWLRSCITGEL